MARDVIGETIKEFKIIGPLGKGGMGEVWVAEQQIIKTKVAIKLLLADVSSDTQHVQRFFNEALAVSKIKHAGIVKIFDVGFHASRAFLIMELLEGETLAARIARARRLALGQVADVGKQIASVLQATHAAGVIHRDLKPENVFLAPDAELASGERVKILDFGIAKLGATTRLTTTGNTMGTPSYMAPEQWNNAASADAPADIYALGCLVFEMCCGRPPFVAASIGEACTMHLTQVPARAGSIVEIPRELDDLIARMLAKRAEERPTTKEIGAVFSAIAASQPLPFGPTVHGTGQIAPPERVGIPVATPAPASTTLGGAASSASVEQPRPRRTGLAVTLGAIVIAGGATAVYVGTRHGPEEPTPPSSPPGPAIVAAPPPETSVNPWVSIVPPSAPVVLGIDDDAAPPSVRGFRPARKIHAPSVAYAIQEHEVTWSEIEPWLGSNKISLEYPPWAIDATARAQLPVTGLTWSLALAYCQSLGAALPTEEQWEYAARGAERRSNSWGDDRLDRGLTHALAGSGAAPTAVKTSPQDRTPAFPDGHRLYDLTGNVQEWTAGLWREDKPGADESWVESGPTSIRAIRGLPLAAEPSVGQRDGAAYRDRLCATGPCVEKGRALRLRVGFRCAKDH